MSEPPRPEPAAEPRPAPAEPRPVEAAGDPAAPGLAAEVLDPAADGPIAAGDPAAEVLDPAAEPAADGSAADGLVAADPVAADAQDPDRRRRPVVERLGMAMIALVMAVLFAVVGAAAFIGGEPFLGVMGVCGCLMVLWVGTITVIRG